MANTNTHHHPRKPRRKRAPSERAQGLEPELTAQPHSLSDDIDLSDDEASRSIDADELGSQFLREAVEQGDRGRGVTELELSLAEEADRPSTEVDLDVLATMSELAVRSGDTSASLRDAAELGAERLDAARERPRTLGQSRSLNLHDSSTRETSLLDREGAGLDETVTPRVDSEDTGRHARSTSTDALGQQTRN